MLKLIDFPLFIWISAIFCVPLREFYKSKYYEGNNS